MKSTRTSLFLIAGIVGFFAAVSPSAASTPGTLSLTAEVFTTCEECGTATITLRRTGGDDGVVSVSYSTTGGSAAAGLDYEAATGTVTWPDNDDDPKSFTITVLDDTVTENDETVFLTLTNPTGGASLGNPSAATLTITDNDQGGGATCTPSATAMCLNDGRFRVTANWATAIGGSGQAHAQRLTSDSGYLWFFNADNIEVVVKVLDGCGVNQHVWVYTAGLTDVQVELTVEDTVAGGMEVYTNPLGTAFQPIFDSTAFAVCP